MVLPGQDMRCGGPRCLRCNANCNGVVTMTRDTSLTELTACTVVDLLRRGEVTPLDCLDALEARVAAVDGAVNALPILCFDRAREQARRLMQRPPGERGLLAGLPVPIKDLTDVAGVRTTYGSPIFADFVPEASDILVTTIEAEGGVIYAKSNTPEFGAGGNTFNEVFGVTLNPWNTRLSAAGSSGGAAVALATGTAWVAQGSDLGGSLRNPASFCGVVGLRPSPGRVASNPGAKIDRLLSVAGPMGRTVEDTALLLDAMTGENPGDPLSLPRTEIFLAAVRSGWRPARVAFSADLGITPVDPEVASICRAAAERFTELGAIVEEAHPDLSEAHQTFQILRGMTFAVSHAGLLQDHRDKMKPDVIWNIEQGLNYHDGRCRLGGKPARCPVPQDERVFRHIRPAALPGNDRGRLSSGPTLREPMRRPCLFELCRVAGHRLRDLPDSVAGAQPPLWLHRRWTSRRLADCRSCPCGRTGSGRSTRP